MSIICKSASLADVVIPLVKVMADATMSWYQREQIAKAIAACHVDWQNQEDRKAANAANAQAQSGAYGQAQGAQGYQQLYNLPKTAE